MTPILRAISCLGLTVVAPLLMWAGMITIETNKALLVFGMVLWFGTVVFWIQRRHV
jgi:hypothetical protein